MPRLGGSDMPVAAFEGAHAWQVRTTTAPLARLAEQCGGGGHLSEVLANDARRPFPSQVFAWVSGLLGRPAKAPPTRHRPPPLFCWRADVERADAR
eukprot:CAMPEP_0175637856 /NCGR_PEP_ID=MMETSP0097-20121207/2927_1 /TAXON_ID=311494 /ORGANISM="Alexandrium monilatum, Strain CCMP3105" /LENGTH=95 /DNA_ID=CAMNT_0016943547 /DNA_START=325 /DNA_END=610 /DNA_ORIENTATION=-